MYEPILNKTVLMSGPKYFSVKELNPYSHQDDQPDTNLAALEFESIKSCLEQAGVVVAKVDEPTGCQDGIFTANWALVRGNIAMLSSLPPQRQAEQAWAKKYLENMGKEVTEVPYHFSGQGDMLACGNLLFAGSGYRTDPRMHKIVADTLGYEVISLQTLPELDEDGKPMTNRTTGWPDSFFYDIDLALSILTPNLIAWCPEAFTLESQAKVRALPIEKIEVSLKEAKEHFACNLVSTGYTVIMSGAAKELKAAIEAKGLAVLTPRIKELAKGGGYIRCTTLTLDNQ
jgi:N-dimethylarginine dimethylaminohydrolase